MKAMLVLLSCAAIAFCTLPLCAAEGGWNPAAGIGAETPGPIHMPDATTFELQLPLEYDGGSPLDATGGPDNSGYFYVDNTGIDTATFEWIELCGDPLANNGPSGDNASTWANLGFYFPFYGTYYHYVFMSTNGLLQFLTQNSNANNRCPFASDDSPSNPQIAVYWDDLYALSSGGCNRNGSAPWVRWRSFPQYFVVEWSEIPHAVNTADRYSFEAILYRDGHIKLQYKSIFAPQNPNSASIGVDRPGAGYGVEYLQCNDNTLPNGTLNRAVWFYRSGRCCYGENICAVIAKLECDALSGQWQDGVDCTSPCTTERPLCPADEILSQQPALPNENVAIQTTDEGSAYRVYDDFHAINSPITGIRVWGCNAQYAQSYDTWSPCSENPMQFIVKFFNDNGSGQPDTMTAVCAYSVSAAPVNTGLVYYGMAVWQLLQYDLELPDPCNLGSGWLMVAGTGGVANCWFVWGSANSGSDGSYQLIPPNMVYSPFSMAYCLTTLPCEPATNVTAYRVAEDEGVVISFMAPSAGNYKVWRTTERNNDGDPDDGTDTDWSLLTTVAAAAGPNTTADSESLPYANYVVVQDCSP